MKRCRHCGKENEEGALVCFECGLDLGPSAVVRFGARLRSAFGGANTKGLWRGVLVLGIPLLVLMVYLFSFGPLLRFYGAKPSTIGSRVPVAVRIIYEPLDRLPIPASLGRLLQRYNRWWMGVEKDKREFREGMALIDASITNGMPQAAVTALLGEQGTWFTNGDTIEAHYVYLPDFVFFGGAFTNGFTIGFSNGVVVRKSRSTIGR